MKETVEDRLVLCLAQLPKPDVDLEMMWHAGWRRRVGGRWVPVLGGGIMDTPLVCMPVYMSPNWI